MSSYYKYIDGVRYANDIFGVADLFLKGKGDGRISLEDAQRIYSTAEDGPGITDTERRTLKYISENYVLTDKAKQWLQDKLQLNAEPNELENLISRVVRNEFGLKNLLWKIDGDEVNQQEQILPGPFPLFESSLRKAIEAFLFKSRDQLSFGAFLNRRGNVNTYQPASEKETKRVLDTGILYLVPMEEADQAKFKHDIPEDLNFDRNWIYILEVPEFYPALFIAYVSREGRSHYSDGYISQKPSINDLSQRIVYDFLGFNGMEWNFDEAEIDNQLHLLSGQNFGSSLFGALNGGIFNGESSISFRDYIQEEIWLDPERDLKEYMFEYINTGILSLIPENYRETDLFIKDQDLWIEGQWHFGLEMQKTQVQFLINVPREYQDGISGWNDGFLHQEERDILEQVWSVAINEFNLRNIKVIFSAEEFQAQKEQFGAQWRDPQTLMRQALNTILDDYITRFSIFNLVAKKHPEIDLENFESVFEYRKAIRNHTLDYLQNATIELLPIELPDNNPIDGEPIEEFWQFFVQLPDLHRQGFWVIIPRFRRGDQLPYVYGEF